MSPDPLDGLRLPSVSIEPRPACADALWRRIAGDEEPLAQSATVRYFVGDLDEAIAFYRDRLGFEEELHPSPTFAMLYRDELRLLLSIPGEPHALARSSPIVSSRTRRILWVFGGLGCSGRVYRTTTTGALAARSSAWAWSAVGWVSFSNVLAWPCRRVVFRVWVASSARSVR